MPSDILFADDVNQHPADDIMMDAFMADLVHKPPAWHGCGGGGLEGDISDLDLSAALEAVGYPSPDNDAEQRRLAGKRQADEELVEYEEPEEHEEVEDEDEDEDEEEKRSPYVIRPSSRRVMADAPLSARSTRHGTRAEKQPHAPAPSSTQQQVRKHHKIPIFS